MRSRACARDHGYAMAALLVAMAIMAIMLSVALPVWRTAVQREREAELVFRGEQYANAIALFQRRTGGYPQTLDVLEKTRAIRRLYKDPITGEDFRPVYVGQMIGGAPVMPGQPGVPGQPGRGAAPPGRAGGPAGPPQIALSGRRGAGAAGPFGGTGFPQTGGRGGVAGGAAGGPIIGVVSTSTAESLRLYNGRGHYNEWAFVATAATQQAGAPTGTQQPGVPGRGGPPGPGRGGRQGIGPGGGPGRGAQPPPFPGRGLQPPGRGIGIQPTNPRQP